MKPVLTKKLLQKNIISEIFSGAGMQNFYTEVVMTALKKPTEKFITIGSLIQILSLTVPP